MKREMNSKRQRNTEKENDPRGEGITQVPSED